ncbi:MAG: hypothetical protein NT040_19700 [Bacteroidetes bacterium]|nr:hypothetical protein [Bacteroidota bacterium]
MGLFMLGIRASAIYSGHHYTIDVILGILCAVAGILVYELVVSKQQFCRKFFGSYYG